eukprot:3530539-Amphidinium_carterae.2
MLALYQQYTSCRFAMLGEAGWVAALVLFSFASASLRKLQIIFCSPWHQPKVAVFCTGLQTRPEGYPCDSASCRVLPRSYSSRCLGPVRGHTAGIAYDIAKQAYGD